MLLFDYLGHRAWRRRLEVNQEITVPNCSKSTGDADAMPSELSIETIDEL